MGKEGIVVSVANLEEECRAPSRVDAFISVVRFLRVWVRVSMCEGDVKASDVCDFNCT